MIQEEGVVIGQRDGKVLVRIERSSACEGCASASICKTIAGGKEMVIEVENPVKARDGERVVVSVREERLLAISSATYLIPTMAFVAGVFIGRALWTYLPHIERDLLSAIGGFVLLFLSLPFLRLFTRRMERKRSIVPVIVKTLS